MTLSIFTCRVGRKPGRERAALCCIHPWFLLQQEIQSSHRVPSQQSMGSNAHLWWHQPLCFWPDLLRHHHNPHTKTGRNLWIHVWWGQLMHRGQGYKKCHLKEFWVCTWWTVLLWVPVQNVWHLWSLLSTGWVLVCTSVEKHHIH